MSRSSWMTRFAPTVSGRPGHSRARVGGTWSDFTDWIFGSDRLAGTAGFLDPHGMSVQRINNVFLRTHEETGELDPNPQVIIVQDNLMTAKNARRLLALMREQLEGANGSLWDIKMAILDPLNLTPGLYELATLDGYAEQLNEFEARLDFYGEALDKVPPETRLGEPGEAAQIFYQQFVEPVMFGWYPNDNSPYPNPSYSGVLEPFASQGPPYSSQQVQVVPDLVTARIILKELGLHGEVWDAASEVLLDDLVKAYTEAAETVVTSLKVGAGLAAVVGLVVLSNMVKR